jgi:hypothetical protein
MKKIRGDKPIGVIIHIYIETSQGNSLCSYLYLKQVKTSHYFLSFLFFFYKIGEQEDRIVLLGRGGDICLVPVVSGGEVPGKRVRKVNTVQKNGYTCM